MAVTGSDRPYVFDLPQVLSLPLGFEFRFRYREDWVDPRVLEQLDRDRSGLAGTKLWLFFHSRSTRRLLPLRICTVVKLERLGPVFFLRFRVDEFPKFDSIKTAPSTKGAEAPRALAEGAHNSAACSVCTRGADISNVARDLILGNQHSLADPLPKKHYLAFAKNDGLAFAWCTSTERPADRPEVTASHWGKTVELLSHEEPELWGVPLFYPLFAHSGDASSSYLQDA